MSCVLGTTLVNGPRFSGLQNHTEFLANIRLVGRHCGFLQPSQVAWGAVGDGAPFALAAYDHATVSQRRNRPGIRHAGAAVKAGLAVTGRPRARPYPNLKSAETRLDMLTWLSVIDPSRRA